MSPFISFYIDLILLVNKFIDNSITHLYTFVTCSVENKYVYIWYMINTDFYTLNKLVSILKIENCSDFKNIKIFYKNFNILSKENSINNSIETNFNIYSIISTTDYNLNDINIFLKNILKKNKENEKILTHLYGISYYNIYYSMYLIWDSIFGMEYLEKIISNNFKNRGLFTHIILFLYFFFDQYSLSIVNLSINSFYFLIFFLLFTKIIRKIFRKYLLTHYVLQTFIKETDHESNSLEDFFTWLIFFFAVFLYNINYSSNTNTLWYSLFLYLAAFIYIVAIFPIMISFIFGVNLMKYIRGVENYNSIITSLFFDILGYTSFCLKYLLQIIRWFLIIGTYITVHNYFFEIDYSNYFNTLINNSYLNYNNKGLITYITPLLRFSLELFDFFAISTIQLTAFFTVLLWLFNSLFSTSFTNEEEINFLKKKIEMLKNFFLSSNFKNFFKSGLYIDFLFKKFIYKYIFIKTNLISILFLEKFLLDYFFKSLYKNIGFSSNFFKNFKENIFIYIIFSLYILIFFYIIFFL